MSDDEMESLMDLIQSKIRQTGKFPKLSELSVLLSIPEYRVTKLLKNLVAHNRLVMVGNLYRLPGWGIPEKLKTQAPTITQPDTQHFVVPSNDSQPILEHVAESSGASTTQSVSTPKHSKIDSKVSSILDDRKITTVKVDSRIDERRITTVLSIVLGLIALGAIVASAYYTTVWSGKSNEVWLSVLISAIIVAFSATSWSVMLLFYKRGNLGWVVFAVLAVITILYSIGSTIAGQYDGYLRKQSNQTERQTTVKAASIKYQEAMDSIETARAELKKAVERRDKFLQIVDSGNSLEERFQAKDEYRNTMADAESRLREAKSDVTRYEAAVESHVRVKNDLLERYPELTATGAGAGGFFEWMAAVLGVPADIVQFWMGVFPAIFLDLIAPVALEAALFMNNERKKAHNKETI